ncbi:MAG: catalase [Beijerinckiaceae bacterium]
MDDNPALARQMVDKPSTTLREDDPKLAHEIVDKLIAGLPDGDTSLRPVHAFGIGATGFFEASDVARDFCSARHFQGDRIPVTVRFSNGSGSATKRDGWSDVRGMATRFHLPDGAATDLIAMTLPEFFTPKASDFLQFSIDVTPVPVARQSFWQKLKDMLQLLRPLPDPYPGQKVSPVPTAIGFADKNDYAKLAVLQGATLGAPVSYARASYHAVHTFIVTAPDGARRWVRFTWQPVDGVMTTDPDDPPVDDYLAEELRKRVLYDPPRFLLMMQIGEAGDDLNDPSRPWPPRRPRVIMGALTIDKVPDDQIEFCERLAFNPMRLAPGIKASGDPVLRARKEAYEYSRKLRGGAACPFSGD